MLLMTIQLRSAPGVKMQFIKSVAKILEMPSGAKMQLLAELFCGRGANAVGKVLYKMCIPFGFHLAHHDFIFSCQFSAVVLLTALCADPLAQFV